MPCYVCVHCGKCPIGDIRATLSCGECGAPLGPGITACPACGADLRHAMQAKAADLGFSRGGAADRFIAGNGFASAEGVSAQDAAQAARRKEAR